MKIKTITCHDVYNVGASLQAYALSHYLETLGNDVEVIDYKPWYLQHYSLKRVYNPQYDKPVLKQIYLLLKLPGRIKALNSKRKKTFDAFTKNYLKLTKERYEDIIELNTKMEQADLFFAGSDQIWNTMFENGKDPSFYLQFVNAPAVKASYAASFATKKVEDLYKDKVRKWISELDFVSVREQSGIKILEELQINNPYLVLDPVFLLPTSEWEQLVNKDAMGEKYIFIYDFEQNPELAELAKSKAKENKWKIYSFLKNPWCDKSFENEGPLEFLSLIYHAEYIVSNSFHATAFSLIFNKSFAVFDRTEGINTRMNDLLQLVQLSKKNDSIDYDRVNRVLECAITESKEYIAKVLEATEERLR